MKTKCDTKFINEYDGIILNERETITNAYKFHGEYKDEDTELYYLRARWYDVDTGRFYSMDEFEGVYEDPSSLHKYVFAGNDGVNRVDYSGMYYGIASVGVAIGMAGILAGIAENVWAGNGITGEAWKHVKDRWNNTDIKNFRRFIYKNYINYIGEKIDCADLAITMLIDYASKKGLPVKLRSYGRIYYSKRTKYKTKKRFLAVAKNYISAEMLYKFNTYEKSKLIYDERKNNIKGLKRAKVGDLMMYLKRGEGYTGHTMIFLDSYGKNIEWIEGSLSHKVERYKSPYKLFFYTRHPDSLRFWDKKRVMGVK